MRWMFVVVIIISVLSAGCHSDTEKEYAETQTHMGTFVTIRFFAEGKAEDEAGKTMAGAFAEIAELDALLSTYKEDSLVSRINREASSHAVPLDAVTRKVLERSLYFSRLTGGAFDISVGPLVHYWRALEEKDEAPDGEAMKNVLKRVGYEKIELSGDGALRFTTEGMEIDLGGIAKGYAADLVVQYLKSEGIRRGLVNLGGDMTVFGGRPGGARWRVGLQNPFVRDALLTDKRTGNDVVIEIADGAVVTSGNYERFHFVRGKRYSHIVDPATGWPVDALPSVTVVAPSGMDADALATAISVLGKGKGIELVEKLSETECLIVDGDKDAFGIVTSSGMGKFLSP